VRSALSVALVTAVLVCLARSPRAASVSQPPPSPSASAVPAPTERITAYTLSPDLYRKAHFLGRLRFAASVFGVLYSVFVPWLLLRRRWSAKFRDWAEAVFGSRFLQGFIYVPLLVLTIGVLVLPLDVLEEAAAMRLAESSASFCTSSSTSFAVALPCVSGMKKRLTT
jgi:hypothetical protein